MAEFEDQTPNWLSEDKVNPKDNQVRKFSANSRRTNSQNRSIGKDVEGSIHNKRLGSTAVNFPTASVQLGKNNTFQRTEKLEDVQNLTGLNQTRQQTSLFKPKGLSNLEQDEDSPLLKNRIQNFRNPTELYQPYGRLDTRDSQIAMNELEQMQRPDTEDNNSILDNTFEGVLKLKEKILTPLRGSDVSQN